LPLLIGHSSSQVALILNDPTLFAEWQQDISGMASRIILMREKLYELLTNKLKTPPVGPNGWDHIIKQIGMFSFTGLSRESLPLPRRRSFVRQLMTRWGRAAQQCKDLVEKAHIYLTANGRISMAGLNESNIEYFAECVDKVVRRTL
jgi:aspartate aminotransferase